MSVKENIGQIRGELPQGVELVAVSKFHPVSAIMEAYEAGQRVFGENRPQELAAKAPGLPCDIRWHFIGHLQTNKLKQVLPYAHMVQSVDSLHLLEAMHAWLERNGRKMDCLLELHLGAEETKTGLTEEEIRSILAHSSDYPCLGFCGLMGMATNTDDERIIRADFSRISALWNELKSAHPELDRFRELSIGMSGDYRIALEYGATMVRIGTGIFGAREY